MIKLVDLLDEDLRKWFGKGKWGGKGGGGWDRYNSKGERVGKCGDGKEGEAYAACLSSAAASKLGKKGRASFVNRKRAAKIPVAPPCDAKPPSQKEMSIRGCSRRVCRLW